MWTAKVVVFGDERGSNFVLQACRYGSFVLKDGMALCMRLQPTTIEKAFSKSGISELVQLSSGDSVACFTCLLAERNEALLSYQSCEEHRIISVEKLRSQLLVSSGSQLSIVSS